MECVLQLLPGSIFNLKFLTMHRIKYILTAGFISIFLLFSGFTFFYPSATHMGAPGLQEDNETFSAEWKRVDSLINAAREAGISDG